MINPEHFQHGRLNNQTTNNFVLDSSTNETASPISPVDFSRDYPSFFLTYVFASFAIAIFVRVVLRRMGYAFRHYYCLQHIRVSSAMIVMILGGCFGYFNGLPKVNKVPLLSILNGQFLFHAIMPCIVFIYAYSVDQGLFWGKLGLISFLAFTGRTFTIAALTGLFFVSPEAYLLRTFTYGLHSLSICFAALISAVDSDALIFSLKKTGNQKYLGAIIEGESLLNFGISVCTFQLMFELLKSVISVVHPPTETEVFLLVLRYSLAALLIGWVMAKFISWTLSKISYDTISQFCITLSSIYLTFYICQVVQTCGSIGVISFGLGLDHSSVSAKVHILLRRFMLLLNYLALTIIFATIGVIIVEDTEYGDFTLWNSGYIVALYGSVIVVRVASIFVFLPVFKFLGIDLNVRHLVVLSWGGMSGFLSLLLVVYLRSYASELLTFHKEYNASDSEYYSSPQQMQRITVYRQALSKATLHAAATVFGAQLINANTIETVMRCCGLLWVTDAQQNAMTNAIERLESNIRRMISVLQNDRFLSGARWGLVHNLTRIEHPYSNLVCKDNKLHLQLRRSIRQVTEVEQDDDSSHKLPADNNIYSGHLEEARQRVIKALKVSYRKQQQNGTLTDYEARVLVSCADDAFTKQGQTVCIEQLEKYWTSTGIYPYLKRHVDFMQYGKKAAALYPPRNRTRKKVFRFVNSYEFEIVMQLVIVLNIIPIAFDFAATDQWHNSEEWYYSLQIVNFFFILLYCVEFILKVIGLGFKQYIHSRWNQFDLFIIIISLVEILIDRIAADELLGGDTAASSGINITKTLRFGRNIKMIRALRVARVLRLSKSVLPSIADFLQRRIDRNLLVGYNIGKGFVTGEEEMGKLIHVISNNPEIQQKLIDVSDRNRLLVTRELSMLQRNQPGIAVREKSKNAVRHILNHTSEMIEQLGRNGVLNEHEILLLERDLRARMEKETAFPKYLNPPTQEEVVDSISWIRGKARLYDFIMQRGQLMDYDYDDIIVQDGDACDGIHIIVQGMVKLKGSLVGHVHNYKLVQDDKFPQATNGGGRKSVSAAPAKSQCHNTMTSGVTTAGAGQAASWHSLISMAPVDDTDYLGPGNVLGEYRYLSKNKKTCTISCETLVQTHFVSVEDLEEACIRFAGLEKRIWKVVATRIALPLYFEDLQYQGMSSHQISLHLMQGYIVELSKIRSTFVLDDYIMEASLIEGHLRVSGTGEILSAPMLLPVENMQVHYVDCQLAVLLVIPDESAMSASRANVVKYNKRGPIVHSMQRRLSKKVRNVERSNELTREMREEEEEEEEEERTTPTSAPSESN